jgi:Flp pilus assembly protein TadD
MKNTDKAHTLLAQSNFELAIKFLARAIQLEPANLEARELLGVAELEGGDPDVGREVSESFKPFFLDLE